MKSDMIIGTIVLVLGIITLLNIRDLAIIQEGKGFGPGAFPLVIGISLVLLAVLLLIKSLFSRSNTDVSKEYTVKPIKPLVIMVATAGYFGLTGVFGFLISTIIFVFFATRIFGEKKYLISFVYAIIFGFLTYFIFTEWLKVVLPKWDW